MPNRSLLRSAVRTSSRLALVLGLALTMSSCAETATCPSGTAHRPTGEGTWSGECVPLADASIDAPPDVDAHVADGGPCRAGCSGETPLCRTSDMTCVECLGDEDCTDNGGGPLCDTTAGRCVPCLTDDDCDASAPVCDLDSHSCIGCTGHPQCARFTEAPACDGESGHCVTCTPDERSACDDGANACKPDHRCSEYPQGLQDACQPCDTDANCIEGQLCIEMSYGDPSPAQTVGSFCQWRVDAELPGPDGSCGINSRPFRKTDPDAVSVDDVAATICTLQTTTCVALMQHDTAVVGCATEFEDDDACGAADFNDGSCRENGAGTPLCTYPCGGTEDCPAGFTCTTGSDKYCSI